MAGARDPLSHEHNLGRYWPPPVQLLPLTIHGYEHVVVTVPSVVLLHVILHPLPD